MKQIVSKSGLAVALSSLKGFYEPKVRQEQYLMDSEIGAFVLWNAYFIGDIGSKVIADLGCGTGILGIGALLLGAKRLFFIDSDEKALKIAKDNVSKIKDFWDARKSSIFDILEAKSEDYGLGKAEFICKDVRDINMKADIALQNPPFGTKVRHNDILFLEKALKIAPIAYSFHKSETKPFLGKFAAKNNAKITHCWDFKFPLKATLAFHRRQIHRIDVSCFRLEKLFK